MRLVAECVLSSDNPASANLAYGRLAHRLCGARTFDPDYREDGSPVWMTAVAEGWQPDHERSAGAALNFCQHCCKPMSAAEMGLIVNHHRP
jgi:hypothetical protein